MRVLIIDDEPLVRRSLSRAFEKKSHQVYIAEDGVKGIEVWLKEKPDIVLLDVLMPGLTGPEVLSEMKGKHTSKVILISAFAGGYNVDTVKEMGAHLFISKPFEDVFRVVSIAELVKDGSYENY